MTRVAILGNSGSGKSTLARKLAERTNAFHLDLDSIAWQPDQPGIRAPIAQSKRQLDALLAPHADWIIEGCYSSLIQLLSATTETLVWLNPGIETCQQHCRNRPWEPHKYPTKADQDKNLVMLLDWVSTYETRDDEFSQSAHRRLFEQFNGRKYELRSPAEMGEFLQKFTV